LNAEPPRNWLFVVSAINQAKRNHDSSYLNDHYDGVDRATHNRLNLGQRPKRFSAEQHTINLIGVNDPTALGKCRASNNRLNFGKRANCFEFKC